MGSSALGMGFVPPVEGCLLITVRCPFIGLDLCFLEGRDADSVILDRLYVHIQSSMLLGLLAKLVDTRRSAASATLINV
jgi:hypothetical protein